MYKFLIKYCCVALMLINATLVFSQNKTAVDSLLIEVDEKIQFEKFDEAENLFIKIKSTDAYKIDSIQLKVDLALAMLFQKQNKDEQALEILLNGLSRVKSNPTSKYISEYAFQIGRKFSKIKNYPKAANYYRIVLENSKLRKDSLGISRGYLALGSIYLNYMKRDFSGADELDKNHVDSSYYYHSKALDYFPKSIKNKASLMGVYDNLIGHYFYLEKYEKASDYGEKSLAISEAQGDSIQMTNTLNNLGAINSVNQNYEKATAYYFQGLNLVKDKKDYKSVEDKQSFLANISYLYNEQEKYKEAYDYRLQYETIKDSLDLASANEKYAEYEAKYNVTEKEKQTEIEKNKRKNAETWLYIVVGSTTGLLLFIWLFYRTQKIKREKEVLSLQKEKLTKEREIEKMNSEAQIKILNATIDAKESERQHISEILHNSVSTLLSSAGLHLLAAKISLKGNAPDEIEKTQNIVKEAGDKIRDLSHTLVSSVLMKFGLSYAMDDLCEKYSNSTLAFENESADIERFDTDFEIKIYSIIEELLNNIIKHSKATNAHILLKQLNGKLEVRIFDDGQGFDVSKLKTRNKLGLGLPQIEARITMMNGIFRIKSSEEIGTRVYINVPIDD